MTKKNSLKQPILIVEDNAMNMELATDLLEVAGFDVLQATTAEEGLAMAYAHHPTIIIMDLGLPGIDGVEAMRRIKADQTLRDIPVIAATAHAMKGYETIVLGKGFDEYIAKPFDTRTFARKIEEMARSTSVPSGEIVLENHDTPHGK